MTITTYHCPKCSTALEPAGEVVVDGTPLPVFQCDTCTVARSVFGPGSKEYRMSFTFAVNAAGQPVDPGDDTLI
jgi:uncharacterized Zn finger protein